MIAVDSCKALWREHGRGVRRGVKGIQASRECTAPQRSNLE